MVVWGQARPGLAGMLRGCQNLLSISGIAMSDLLVSPAKASRRLRHSRWPESAAWAARWAAPVVFGLLAGAAVLAADTGGSTVQAQDPLAAARTQVAARRWADAVAELKRVDRKSTRLNSSHG